MTASAEVLLVACPSAYARALPPDAHAVEIPDWREPPERVAEPELVIVGPLEPKPTHAAQQLASRHPGCGLLLVTEPGRVPEISAQLALTPFVPLGTRVVAEPQVEEAVREVLLRARLQRSHARLTDRARDALDAPTPADGGRGGPVSGREPRADVGSDALLELHHSYKTRELLFSSVFESSQDAIYSATMQGTITSWNRAAERLYGYSAGEAIGCHIGLLLPEEQRDAQNRLMASLAEGETTGTLEGIHRTRGGGHVEVSATVSLIRDGRGSPSGTCTIARDLGPRLREARAKTAMLDGALDAIVAMDHRGNVVEYNQAAEEIFGFSAQEALGRSVADLIVPPELREAHRTALARYLETREASILGRRLELTAVRRGGERFPVEASIVRLAGTEPPLFTAFLRDTTELEKARRQLERTIEDLEHSNQDLEQFAYVASHDLQEPLRMVVSYMELFHREYGASLDERGEQFLRHAVDGSRRMKALVDDLLAYSRIESRGTPFEWCSSGRILEGVLHDLALLVEETGARITCAPDLPCIRADASQIEHVFQNLVTNAIKFRGERPPHISIGALRTNGAWEFVVEDDGIGFDESEAGRMFQMFQRLHERSRFEGSGIGLTFAKRIVERHGGRIWAESKPGEGTRFHFTIPVAAGDPPGGDDPEGSDDPEDGDDPEGGRS